MNGALTPTVTHPPSPTAHNTARHRTPPH